MFIHEALLCRAKNQSPIRVGLIVARKFGSMFLAQVPSTPGFEVVAIRDLFPDQAKATCASIGWSKELIAQTIFAQDAVEIMQSVEPDVIVEATGDPIAGITHARHAIASRRHIVMVKVESDVLSGSFLAQEAEEAEVVYWMAYDDQPALTCELVDWARSSGFRVIAAGKGTKYLPLIIFLHQILCGSIMG